MKLVKQKKKHTCLNELFIICFAILSYFISKALLHKLSFIQFALLELIYLVLIYQGQKLDDLNQRTTNSQPLDLRHTLFIATICKYFMLCFSSLLLAQILQINKIKSYKNLTKLTILFCTYKIFLKNSACTYTLVYLVAINFVFFSIVMFLMCLVSCNNSF